MDETKLVDSLYGKSDFGHVETCDVFGENFVLDQHSHQIASRQKLHKHVKEGTVLESRVQLDDPRAVRLSENITLRADVGELVLLELSAVSMCTCERRKESNEPFQP